MVTKYDYQISDLKKKFNSAEAQGHAILVAVDSLDTTSERNK